MVRFDKHGNPQPPGVIAYSIDEFKSTFVDSFIESEIRAKIFRNYEQYLQELKALVVDEFKQWINGSYTTTKLNPNDIDLVNVIPYTEALNQKYDLVLNFLTIGGSKDNYLIDDYLIQVYPEDDPRTTLTQQQLDYWSDWFSHDRQGRAKALIEIIIK